MDEALLQILLILAYLSIGLISVTFPIYAICVTYLRQEVKESIKWRKKKVEELKKTISDLTQELSGREKDSKHFQSIKEQIKNYKAELKKERIGHLTATGAVLIPIILLVSALITACLGIYCLYSGWDFRLGFFTGASVMLCGTAFWSLFKTVMTIESAALRPARTIDFHMYFGKPRSGQRTEARLGKKSLLTIFACPREENVDNFVMYLKVPNELGVPEDQHWGAVEYTKHSDHMILVVRTPFLPKEAARGIAFYAIPKKIGTCIIHGFAGAKGFSTYSKKFVVNIVK